MTTPVVAAPAAPYRLEIITDPDPDTPARVVSLRATGTTAAIEQARRVLAAQDGPGDQYGELYRPDGEHVDTIHLGA